MTRYVLALAMTLLVVTAGCSTGVLQDEGTPTPGDATTPGEDGATATSTPTSTASGLAPGVSESSLENETALFAANKRAFEESAHVVTARTELAGGGDDSPLLESRSTLRRSDGGEEYQRHVVNHSLQGNTTMEVWFDGSTTLTRTWENTSFQPEPQVTFGTAASPDRVGVEWPGTSGTFLLIRFLEYEVAGESSGRVTLTATGANETMLDGVYDDDVTVTSYEGELVVDRQGRILSFEGHIDVDPGEDTGSFTGVEASYELESTEDVSVERPDWVSDARDAVPIVDVTVDVVDGTYVEVTNEGPDAIPAGAQVGLFEGSTGGSVATLDQSVEPGESIYLFERTDHPSPGIARAEPDGSARELSGSYTVHVAGTGGDVLVEETVTVGE